MGGEGKGRAGRKRRGRKGEMRGEGMEGRRGPGIQPLPYYYAYKETGRGGKRGLWTQCYYNNRCLIIIIIIIIIIIN